MLSCVPLELRDGAWVRVQLPVRQRVKIRDRPRLRIHFRIVEGKDDLQSVMVHPLPASFGGSDSLSGKPCQVRNCLPL